MAAVTDTTPVDVAPAGTNEASTAARPTAHGTTLQYNPGFDGIRGLAVAAVLLFHHEVSWVPGGYLGVSTFFTLSGFLITSLLLTEHARTGNVRLTAFWARRMRRLLPASTATLLGIVGLALVVDQPWERSLRGDLLAGVGQVANWRFLLGERSYAELFADDSPVQHFWSLAIEEQFYWVFPLLTFAVLAVGRRSLRVYAAVLAAATVLSAGYTFWLGVEETDAVYYSTFTRMAEILLGALLAVGLALVGGQARLSRLRWIAPVAAAAGVVALALSAYAWGTVAQSDEGLYRGGLLLYGVVSVGLVAGAALSLSLRRGLGWGPLRWLGLVSYGAYLFHWPIFLFLDAERTGLDAASWELGALRIGVTLLAAGLSYRVLEQPIRRGVWPVLDAARWAGGAVASVVVVALLLPMVSPPPPADPYAAAMAQAQAEVEALPAHIPRGVVLGDSMALLTGAGISNWGKDNEQLAVVGYVGELGCPIGRGGRIRQNGSAWTLDAERCDWSESWPAKIDEQDDQDPKIAVIFTGAWDILDRKIPDDDEWRGPGDPVYDEYLLDEMNAAADMLTEQGLEVVWLTIPPLEFGRNQQPRPPLDPPDMLDRVDRFNELIEEVGERHPNVEVVDLAGYYAGLPEGEDERLRPDGVHVEMHTANEVGQWLGPEIMAAANTLPTP